ncbi:MAG: class I SAM-dependent methyltransferase [Synechococcaceae cyanobacterium]
MDDRAHKYDYLVDINSNTAAAKVINFVGQRKRVLEIGCGPGSITKHLKNDNHCSIVGLEVDPDAIKLVTPFCEQVLSVDLNNADWNQLAETVGSFQTIVAADVLEHLYDPWSVLTRLRPLLDTGGEIVVSLPHVGHAAISGCLIHGSFEYRDWGLLDRTHIRFFDLAGVDRLFGSNGYKIIDVSFVITPPEETEFAAIWSELDEKIKQVLRQPIHANVYQVVVKAVPDDSDGVAVSVASAIQQLPRPVQPNASIVSKLKKLVHRLRV